MSTLKDSSKYIGFQLNSEKTVKPQTCLIFLGIEIATVFMQITGPHVMVNDNKKFKRFYVTQSQKND